MHLNRSLDREAFRLEYAVQGRVRIPDFLDLPSAERLHRYLAASKDWRLHVNQQQGDKLFELLPEVLAGLGRERRDQFERSIHAQAQWGFQFCFEAIRAEHPGPDPLAEYLQLMCADEALELFRYVTGSERIHFADAQATAYGSGHFLTAHDDSNPGQSRVAAYVLNLTPVWRLAWGGLLQFHDADGDVERALVPGFNMLNLFSVPQPHSVSYVTPFAAHKRYSVTGWLRTR